MSISINIFRIHIKSASERKSTFEFCLENNLLGVGWCVEADCDIDDFEIYHNLAKEYYRKRKLTIPKYIFDNVNLDDLIWTRDWRGNYFLAKVESRWFYTEIKFNSNLKNIDIHNVVRVKFKKINREDVPGKVIASFRASRSIQRISSDTVNIYSKYLWNDKKLEDYYKLKKTKIDIFDFFDSEEIEDLIAIYLQKEKDLIFIPNSRKNDTVHYEYILLGKRDKKINRVQVKTGYSNINLAEYKPENLKEKVFLFQTHNKYQNEHLINEHNIVLIQPEEILKFLETNIQLLPSIYKNKMDLIKYLSDEKKA